MKNIFTEQAKNKILKIEMKHSKTIHRKYSYSQMRVTMALLAA